MTLVELVDPLWFWVFGVTCIGLGYLGFRKLHPAD